MSLFILINSHLTGANFRCFPQHEKCICFRFNLFCFFSQHDSSSRMYLHEIGNCLSASGAMKPQNPSVQNHTRPEGGGNGNVFWRKTKNKAVNLLTRTVLGCVCAGPGRTFSFLVPNNPERKPTAWLPTAKPGGANANRAVMLQSQPPSASVARRASSILRISCPLVSKCDCSRAPAPLADLRVRGARRDLQTFVQADKKAST